MVQRPKIAYITLVDPGTRHSWSGTNYYLLQTLKKYVGDVDALGPAEPFFASFVCKTLNFLSLKIFGKRIDYRHGRMYAKACSALFQKKLAQKKYDLIVCPGNIASISYLQTQAPIVAVGDRSVLSSLNYHPIFSKLWKFSEQASAETEARALKNCALAIYPSAWAANSVINGYHIDKNKVAVIPFGANMDVYPPAELIAKKKKNAVCHLLFVGVNWELKGGPVAADCLRELMQMGIDAKLTVVGCKVPEEYRSDKIVNYEFLNKNKPGEADKFKELFLQSDIFILPTRIDAYGLVFCEASAYGVPSLGTNTGGVAGALHDGVNGYLLPEGATGKEYAKKAAELFSDEVVYQQMSRSSRKLFEEKLNWDAFGNSLMQWLQDKGIMR